MCLAGQGTALRTTGSSSEELRRVPQCGAIHPPYPTRMDPRDALTQPRDAAPAPHKTFVLSGLRGWGRAPRLRARASAGPGSEGFCPKEGSEGGELGG